MFSLSQYGKFSRNRLVFNLQFNWRGLYMVSEFFDVLLEVGNISSFFSISSNRKASRHFHDFIRTVRTCTSRYVRILSKCIPTSNAPIETRANNDTYPRPSNQNTRSHAFLRFTL
ncbi:hypothetical protein CW304_04730 [Bacillus sp. UFRGS-B20]|nr:hypothetical protein CW304_04730 [Bacillus sp. UFRGS-B20]